jgi:hypothetical protein
LLRAYQFLISVVRSMVHLGRSTGLTHLIGELWLQDLWVYVLSHAIQLLEQHSFSWVLDVVYFVDEILSVETHLCYIDLK